jgi:hypothetical protein
MIDLKLLMLLVSTEEKIIGGLCNAQKNRSEVIDLSADVHRSSQLKISRAFRETRKSTKTIRHAAFMTLFKIILRRITRTLISRTLVLFQIHIFYQLFSILFTLLCNCLYNNIRGTQSNNPWFSATSIGMLIIIFISHTNLERVFFYLFLTK